MDQYSVRKISQRLISDISLALQSVGNFGSVEIYIQKGSVSQITYRRIIKTLKSDRGVKITQK